LRKRMREAVAASDLPVMLELTSPEHLPSLEPGSIFVLSAELWGDGAEERQPGVYRILDQARALYPGDFVLQAMAGYFYRQDNKGRHFEVALDCRTAALSLRPHDLDARASVGESQYLLGHLSAARTTLLACVAAEPADPSTNHQLGVVQLLLGDFAGALASLSRVPAIATDPDRRAALHVAQFYGGLLARDEIERRATSEGSPDGLAAYLLALLDHPDPAERDPDFVLRLLKQWAPLIPTYRWPPVIETLARVRLEDWSGALSAIESRFQPPNLMLLSPMAYDFVRARIYAELARPDEARACYARGMVVWECETIDDPAAWERSDAMRWRRAAEAALPR
jgi:tetratricopeptide (TPR) repeat protein